MKRIVLRDTPITTEDQDYLDLNKYAGALIKFIESTQTPFTISLQGELGSGKSSLMHLLKNHLVNNGDSSYECIWINTWELNILEKENEILDKLSSSILNELKQLAKKNDIIIDTELEELSKTIKKIMLTATDLALITKGVDEKLRNKTLSFFDKEPSNNVAYIRRKLETIIDKLVTDDNGFSDKGIVFFIDDLDRVEPHQAVSILEGIKNIFDVNHCIFVLAIDYDIVVKGLRSKYYHQYEVDDEVYNSYFDKLIQLPFVMPMEKYNIENFIINALVESGYLKEDEYLDDFYKKALINAITYSLGKNPRSIKRLVNSAKLSLIYDQLNDNRLSELSLRIANIYLLCMQMEYQKVYSNFDAHLILSEFFLAEFQEEKEKFCALPRFIESFQDLVRYSEDISLNQLAKITNLSSMTFIAREVKEKLLFKGDDYNKSSQTQFYQGNKLISKISIEEGSHVLDIGCGNGKTTIELWHRFPRINIDAFDLSTSQIENAQRNLIESKIPKEYVRFYTKNAMKITYDNKYDFVFSNAVLHWITEPEVIYTKVFDSLKNGGRIGIHQGGYDSYRGLHKLVWESIEKLGYRKYYEDWKFPIYYPEKEQLEKILRRIGFSEINIDSVITDGSELNNLVENFTKASLRPYFERLPEESMAYKLEDMFLQTSQSTDVDLYTHRLYVLAKKV